MLLTSHQAFELSASFSFHAEQIRNAEGECTVRARFCELASRVAFLRAHAIAREEESRPVFGQIGRRAAFAVA